MGWRRRWTSRRYRLMRGLVIANELLMTIPLRRSGAPSRSGQIFERTASGETLIDRMPVPDLLLSAAPAEADDLPARHRVKVDEAQLEIANDASVVGDLRERLAEAVESRRVGSLLLPEGAHVGVRPGRSGALDCREHLELPAEGRDLATQGGQFGEGPLQCGDEAVRFLDREDLVPNAFHHRP